MEFLAEALVALLQVFGEFILQLLLEALAELGGRGAASIYRSRPDPKPFPPVLAGLTYAALGAGLGALSLHFFPTSLAHATWLRILTLVVVPVLAGLAMNAVGNWRLRHDQTIIRLDRFGYAYLFALALAAETPTDDRLTVTAPPPPSPLD
eukprot:gene17489-21394_t